MKNSINQLILSVLLCLFVVSCQDGTSQKKPDAGNPNPAATETVTNQPAQNAEASGPGKDAYTKYCLVCHQADGSGVPGMFPPLKVGSWAGKDPKELVLIIEHGLSGKIEVNGKNFNSAMPAQAQLTDQEIANVLTYIRSSFGNRFDAVDVETVRKIRKNAN